jgi:predicted ester cyclase
MLAERDWVVTRWRAHGTHRGSFRGIPPTGKRVEVTGIAVDRVIAGARVEGWVQWDILGLLQQLGAKLVVE